MAYARSRQSIDISHTQNMEVDEDLNGTQNSSPSGHLGAAWTFKGRFWHTWDSSNISCAGPYKGSDPGGGGTLIFSYIRRLEPFLGSNV